MAAPPRNFRELGEQLRALGASMRVWTDADGRWRAQVSPRASKPFYGNARTLDDAIEAALTAQFRGIDVVTR